MIDAFLIYGIGWQWWALLSAPTIIVAALFLARIVGPVRAVQIGAALGVALGAFSALRRARQQGWQDREDKLNRDTAEAVDDYRKKQDEVADLSGAELDRRAGRWVRGEDAGT